jgi:hypothetical protein
MADVDEQGCLLPLGLRSRLINGDPLPGQPEPTLRERAEMRFAVVSMLAPKVQYSLLACGELSQAAYASLNEAVFPQAKHETGTGAPIPAWLGEHPPYQTVFLPNGEIICYGELDLHFEEPEVASPFVNSNTQWPPRLEWFRYSAEGELLSRDIIANELDGRDWQQLFYNHQPAFHGYVPMGNQKERPQTDYFLGYQLVFNQTWKEVDLDGSPAWNVDSAELLSATDWQGQPVDLDSPAPPVPPGYLTAVSRNDLTQQYQLQVQRGQSDPSAESPFAGLPNGPQLADPTPRPVPLYARAYTDNAPYVLVEELDSPANPYREQYQPWDYWLRTRVGKDFFFEPGVYEAAQKQHDEAIAAAEATGDKQAIDKARNESLSIQLPEDWEHFNLQVDADGFIKPYLQTTRTQNNLSLCEAGATPRACYEKYLETFLAQGNQNRHQSWLVATGAMPAEMKQQYLSAKWDNLAWDFPTVPAWLVQRQQSQNSSGTVMLLRDGRSVLSRLMFDTASGEFDENGTPRPQITGAVTLYAADGGEIQSYQVLSTEYNEVPQALDVLFPGYRALADKAQSAGQFLLEIPGVCLVLLERDFGRLDRTVAHSIDEFPNPIQAFTLTGEPLELDAAIPFGLTAFQLTDKDAVELYDAQQRVPKP